MDFKHKTLIIIAKLAFLFFWGCNGEKKIKSGNYFINLEEKTFLLPDTICSFRLKVGLVTLRF